MESAITTYKDKPCRCNEMTVGNTTFMVISVQSDAAKETAYDKVKRLVLDGVDSINGTENDMTPFIYIFNEFYAKDTNRKIS